MRTGGAAGLPRQSTELENSHGLYRHHTCCGVIEGLTDMTLPGYASWLIAKRVPGSNELIVTT